jgi:hypothetical protein
MPTPTGTKLYEIHDQVRTDIFGTNASWTADATSGIPVSAMDIYSQKIASRINLHTEDSHVSLNLTTGAVSPANDSIYALLEMGILMVIKETEQSLLKRLATGLGMTSTGTAEGASVRNADGVAISTVARFQERIRAFLSDKHNAREDFKEALAQYKYDFRAGHGLYVY